MPIREKSAWFFVHDVIMVCPPGAGKALLARAMPSILPPEMIVRTRPFRAPHHTIIHAGLVGGGNWLHPGEISLAHRGVLFLEDLAEFGTRVVEMMRQQGRRRGRRDPIS